MLRIPAASLSPRGLAYHQRGHLVRFDMTHITLDATLVARIPIEVIAIDLPFVVVPSDFFDPAKHHITRLI